MAGGLPGADAVCDGGDLDCGSGLLLIIRSAMEGIPAGGVLEVRSREGSVREDLPAWCGMVGHTLLGTEDRDAATTSYFLRKRAADASLGGDLEKARDFVWRARVRWTGGMQAKAFVRNHSFAVGQPASFDTEDPAPSAVEYLLGALAGALAVGFQWRASRERTEVRNLEVSLSARSANILVFLGIEPPGDPGLSRVEGTLYVDADAEDEALDALFRETLERCPIARTLSKSALLDIHWRRA